MITGAFFFIGKKVSIERIRAIDVSNHIRVQYECEVELTPIQRGYYEKVIVVWLIAEHYGDFGMFRMVGMAGTGP